MNHRFFNECIIHDELAKLDAMRRAIPRWEAVALEEIEALAPVQHTSMSDQEREWREHYVNDQHFLVDQVTNGLCAGLAVSVVAVIESTLGMLCAEQNLALPDKPNWGHKRSAVETVLTVSALDMLPGFALANRARLLANCYKHHGGQTNSEWRSQIGGTEGQEIRYADENWEGIINGVREFLIALVLALPAK